MHPSPSRTILQKLQNGLVSLMDLAPDERIVAAVALGLAWLVLLLAALQTNHRVKNNCIKNINLVLTMPAP